MASAAEPAPSIEGAWEGRYVCGQGPTGASLTIKALPYWPGFQVYLHRLLMGWLRNPETNVAEVHRSTSRSRRNFAFTSSRKIHAFRAAPSS